MTNEDWRTIGSERPVHTGYERSPEVGDPGRYGGMPDFGKGATIFTGIVAAKAAKNWYDITGDPKEAAQRGVESFVHWTIWSIVVLMWWVVLLVSGLNYPEPSEQVFLFFLSLCFAPFTIGVTWCRNIDRSLFRRGKLYRLYQPLARRCEQVGTGWFYAAAAVFTLFTMFT